MKQAHFGATRDPAAGRGWPAGRVEARLLRASGPALYAPPPVPSWSWGRSVVSLLGVVWWLVTLPFRLVFTTIAWLGRLTGVAVGFVLMVAGMFLLAGPLFLIGIPLFLVGLVLTLRCLA